MITSPKTNASESKNTTTETTTKPTGALSPTEPINDKNSSPTVIKNGQILENPDDDAKAADPSTSSKPTSGITTSPSTTSPNTTPSNTTPKTNKTTKTVPSVKTGEW
jgi:hypothetical protein